jgi:hypothetical protein
MDVTAMATMPVAMNRSAAASTASTERASAGGFGAALSAAAGEGDTPESPPASSASTGGATKTGGTKAGGVGAKASLPGTPMRPDEDPAATGLAGALGLSGLVVARALPTGLQGLPIAGGGMAGGLSFAGLAVSDERPAAAALAGLAGPLTAAQRGLQAGLAARGFAALQEALRGPDAAPTGGEGGDVTAQLAAGARQDALTQELAHLLSARTGPLPAFGAEAPPEPPPGAAAPGTSTNAAAGDAVPAKTASAEVAPFAPGGDRDDGPAPTEDTPSVAAARDAERLATGPDGERPVECLAGARAGLSEGTSGGPTPPGAGPLTPTVSAPTAAPATPAPAPGYAPTNPTLPPGGEAPAVLRQIGDGLKLLTQGNRQTAEIRLDPVELGKVRVRMEIEGKDVRMYVTTENAGVRDVVAAGLDGLRRDLMAQGLQVQHVSVDVQADARSFGQHRHDERPEGDAATGERIGSDAAQPAGGSPRTRTPRDGKRIDLTA